MEGPISESTHTCYSENTPCDAGNFECHICFELAQEPIVTLCGHLYCWPCLYQWLQLHSHAHECPICKAYIQDDDLIPIYGRGKSGPDPRSRFVPSITIPSRPTGQRPRTALLVDTDHVQENDWDPTNGFMPMAAVRIGHMTLSTIFGVLPKIFSLQVNRFHHDATVYGTTSGGPYLFSSSFRGDYLHGFQRYHSVRSELKTMALKYALVALFIVVLLSLLFA